MSPISTGSISLDSTFKEHKMYSGQRSRRNGGETRYQAVSEDYPFRSINWIPIGVAGNREAGGWSEISDERLDIKQSQKALPLRSINCIPVGVAGNMEAGGWLEMTGMRGCLFWICRTASIKQTTSCIQPEKYLISLSDICTPKYNICQCHT